MTEIARETLESHLPRRREARLSASLHDSAWQDILVLAAVPATDRSLRRDATGRSPRGFRKAGRWRDAARRDQKRSWRPRPRR